MKLFLVFTFIFPFILFSQPKEDTIRTYRLGEIVTEGTRADGADIQPTKIKEIRHFEIKEQDATNFQELNSLLPSGFIQTNSRGESLIFLRGAGERSIALFFDGIYFNIPWDNRLDLSMIPTDIIGNVKISTGANSVLYGANVLGGAVNIATTERESEGVGGNISLQVGEGGKKYSSLQLNGKEGNFNYIGNLTFSGRDGLVASRDNNFIYKIDSEEDYIPNSYSERISAYARGEYQFNEHDRLGLSFNHINGEQGVIPENYPDSIKSRFWQYPEWKRSIVTLNGAANIFEDINFKGALWFDKFNQTIEDYEDIEYQDINETQFDEDITIGTRLNFSYGASDNDILQLSLSGYNSMHNEKKENGEITNKDYQQRTSSIGLEYRRLFKDLTLTAGVSYDRFDVIKAGDFNEAEGKTYDDIGAILGLNYTINDQYSIFANTGRKSRFPTMRESYSAAINKFIVNPDLEPETGLLNEVGVDYSDMDLDITLSIFSNFYDNLLAKEIVEGDSLNREQRINLNEARIMGAEFVFNYYLTNDLDISGHLTYMNSQGIEDGEETELEYKPEIIAYMQLDWRFYQGFDFLAEADFMGTQFGNSAITEDLVEIEPTILLHSRISYKVPHNENLYTLYIRANNLLDTDRIDKIGIPSPGRTLMGGINIGF